MERKIHYHILVINYFRYLVPSSLNLQIFWLEDPRAVLLSAGRKQAGEPERERCSLVEQAYPPEIQASPKSTVPFCSAPQATSERKTQQVKKTAHTPPRVLTPLTEQKKGRGKKTTENPTGLGIMVPVASKRVSFLWNEGVFSSLNVLAEYLLSALS